MTARERFLFWLGIANLCLFVGVALVLGGDAINGTSRDGHYFLMEHGHYTEVSRPVFIYSVVHTFSLFITSPLALVVAFRARHRARQSSE
jgi:hypothetical protein